MYGWTPHKDQTTYATPGEYNDTIYHLILTRVVYVYYVTYIMLDYLH